MTPKDLDYVRATVENEGFDYAFRHYSDFKTIDDAVFHQLRTAYVEAAKALATYLNIEGV